MNCLNIKRFVLLVGIVFVAIACKREVDPNVGDFNELTFVANRPASLESQMAAPSKSGTLEEFGDGCYVGLYTQLKSESESGSGIVMKNNSLYTYSVPVWSPATKEEKLTYDEVNNAPVYVFGYYPHPSMPGATTTIATGATTVDYSIHKDQSTPEILKLSDLLWVGARNNGSGYVRQRTPLSLLFQHSLCKVSFYVRLIDSNPSINNPQKAYLRNLATIGEQIASKASLDVLSGVLSPEYAAVPMDSVYWNSTSTTGVELIVGAEPVHITDMLLIPFQAQSRKNYFRSMIYYDAEDRAQNFNAYIPQYDPSATGNSASKLCFESNKHNKVTITIDISDIYMSITADIAPWGIGPETDLPAERD